MKPLPAYVVIRRTAVTDVIQRGTWWANGPEIGEFERKMADAAGTRHAVAFNSGTSALYANLLAHGLTDGEVIVPSFTFPATANAVVAAGGTPVFADIERDSLALSAASVADAITDETVAIMPIHFGGDVAPDIRALQVLADDHGLTLLEDACHSPGVSMDGDPAGSLGSRASFSFYFNKLLTTGEGGWSSPTRPRFATPCAASGRTAGTTTAIRSPTATTSGWRR